MYEGESRLNSQLKNQSLRCYISFQVRVADNNPGLVQRALDAGAFGKIKKNLKCEKNLFK